jgi:hypothetical protein
VVHWLLVVSRHSFRFSSLSDVKLLCFTTLSTSFSHFTSGRPRRRLPSGGQVIYYSLRPSVILHTYYVSTQFQHAVFQSFQNVCVTHTFSLITSFFTFRILEVLEAFLYKSIYVFSIFSFNL